MSQQKSYNELIDFINEFADNHLQIKSFGEGTRAVLNTYVTENENFPILYVEPLSQTMIQWTQQYRIRVYCLDALNKDISNKRDVLSDCLQILNDLYKYIKNYGLTAGENNWNIIGNPVSFPSSNITPEYFGGWFTEFVIEVTLNDNDCDIPIN
jgi:hypothetical protein